MKKIFEIKLVAIVPFYNDFKALQRLLMHLNSNKLPAIFCDGRFHNFERIGNSDISTDGSRFLIHGFKNTSLIELSPCYVDEKINKLLHEAARQNYSHTILLGCDEYPEGDFDLFQKNLQTLEQTEPRIFRVPFHEHKSKLDKPVDYIERVFFMPGLFRAKGNHNTFFSAVDQAKGNITPMKSHSSVISGMTIHHDSSIRDKKRNELMKDYQNYLKKPS
jgi:hypothetical protein